ncbi:MAG: TylF/MycF/NovP-related O-methyltransferase [Gammaproteobacteria bacterium]
MNENNEEISANSKLLKFDASIPFSHELPYDDFIAERIPVLNIFQRALCLCYQEQLFRIKALLSLPTNNKDANYTTEPFYAAECGVYKGSSLVACGKIAKESGLPIQIVGLDTFSGFPDMSTLDQEIAPDDAPYLNRRFFEDTSLDSVNSLVKNEALEEYIKLIPGKFSDSFKKMHGRKYFFVNLDCDLYDAHMECLEYFYPRMNKGGIVFFDDYDSLHYPHAKQAIDEFMQTKPERLFHIRYGKDEKNHTKAFIVKF